MKRILIYQVIMMKNLIYHQIYYKEINSVSYIMRQLRENKDKKKFIQCSLIQIVHFSLN